MSELPRPRRRAARRALLLRAMVLLSALALPRSVHAHGALRSAEPRAGARLATLPRDLRLTFTEAVELAVARLALTGPDGRPVPLSPVRRGPSAAVIVADLLPDSAGPLRAGEYTVAWQVAGRDGHPVHGTYRFTILPAAVAAAQAAAPAPPAGAAPDTARHRPGRAWLPLAACAVAAAVGAACSGHAVADEHHPALAFAADTLHVLAAGGWVGTLLLLAVAALPAVRHAEGRGTARLAAAAALVGAFSPWALACAAVAATTGATSAWIHLGAPAALWSTPYGRTLLVKLALLVPAAAAGANNWRRLRPALAAGTDATPELSRSVALELLAAAAVVAVTAILVAVSPP